ncbi:MAG: nucleotide exchange factor GrpE [Alphaproteobacteria bacterium]|jgi:molecular chaperone GrpE
MIEPVRNEHEPAPEGADGDLPENQDASPEAVARALTAVIDAKDKELAALKDQALRALAEAENTRRRAERDQQDTAKYAVSRFAGDLVSVLENLQRATASIPESMRVENSAVANLAVGVEMTLKELLGAFEKHGIRRLDPKGQKFDHQLHQAVAQMPDAQVEPGTILQVIEAGYTIHDRLLRPAMVVVATRAETPQPVDTQA